MKVIAAYLLAVLGGNASPDAAAINKVLSSVGASAEADAVSAFLAEVNGKDIWELVSAGTAKLASAPSGGAAGPAAAAAAPSSSSAAAEPAEEKKKSESEADVGGTFDLFGGEGGDGDAADY